jgi:hypothetical protein
MKQKRYDLRKNYPILPWYPIQIDFFIKSAAAPIWIRFHISSKSILKPFRKPRKIKNILSIFSNIPSSAQFKTCTLFLSKIHSFPIDGCVKYTKAHLSCIYEIEHTSPYPIIYWSFVYICTLVYLCLKMKTSRWWCYIESWRSRLFGYNFLDWSQKLI